MKVFEPLELEGINNIHNEMNELTSNFINDIAKKREALVLDRLNELNIDIDLKEEEKRVFKRFASIRNGNEEIILYNDGSIKGLRIITFVTKETTNIKFDAEKFSIGYETSYY